MRLGTPWKAKLSFCDPTGMPITKILSIEIMLSRSIYNGLFRDKQMNLFFSNGTPSAKVDEERRVAVQVGSRRISYLDAESVANFVLILQRWNDIPDLERLFCVQAETFDFEFFECILLRQIKEDDDIMKLIYELRRQFGVTKQNNLK